MRFSHDQWLRHVPRHVLRGALAAWLACSLVACGFPTAPAYPSKEDGFSGPNPVPRPGLPGDAALPLKLQPGDVLTIELASDPPRTLPGVVIDGTGQVHMPMAGDVAIGSLGLTEAEKTLEAALKQYDKFVQVTITLTEPRGQRATVLGAVVQQGNVTLIPGARVTDVIAAVGGPLTSSADGIPVMLADLGGAVLIRGGSTQPVSIARALEGDPLHNVFIRPGDHIYVPPAFGRSVTVLGQVGAPRVLPHQVGLRLSQVLAMSGGVTVGADKGDIRVIRGSLEAPRVYQASLADFVDGDVHDVSLQPGDIVFVTDHAIEDVGEVLSVVSPALSLGFSSLALAISLNQDNGSSSGD
jgi:protein involved in polysaccharide export with SLBB domain